MVAFTVLETCQYCASRDDLYVMAANGKRPRRVAINVLVGGFSWSPDSTRLAYEYDLNISHVVIYTVGADGRHRSRLAAGIYPSWSPSGGLIAFDAAGGLFVVNARGGRPRWLAAPSSLAGPLSWSPDGTRIAFWEYPSQFGVADVATGWVRRLGLGVDPTWSPDGRWLAFGLKGTYVVRPDGSGLHLLSKLDPRYTPPTWAPDSSAVAISGSFESQPRRDEIWVIPLHGGGARRLTEGWRYGYDSRDPQWQPAGVPMARLPGTFVSAANPSDSAVHGHTLWTTQPVVSLAADGSRVALEPLAPATEVWDPAAGSIVRFHGSSNVGRDEPSLLQVGLAGDRVGWGRAPSNARDSEHVATATTEFPAPVYLYPSGITGSMLGDLVGHDGLLVFDSWHASCTSLLSLCTLGPKTNGSLWRLDGPEAVQIASSDTGLTPRSVDAGRILVDHGDGTMDIRTADGTLVRSFSFNPALVEGARLQGDDLVVQTPTAIEVTDASTGQFVRRWLIPASNAVLTDLQDGIAVLVAGTDIHLLRLQDGKDAVIHTPSSGPVLAQLESPGLYYSYTTDDPKYPGRVSFVPNDQLPLR
jgi:Tol biopolymer transport system component